MTKVEREAARKRRDRRRVLLWAVVFGAADAVLLGVLRALGGWSSVLTAALLPALLLEAGAVLLRPWLRTAGWLPRTPGTDGRALRAQLPAYLRADPGDGENAPLIALPASYAGGRLVVDTGAAEPVLWQRRRFPLGFDEAGAVPLRPPYQVWRAGPATGTGAASVDPLVYRQIELEAAGAGVALAVPENALGFVRAALAAAGRPPEETDPCPREGGDHS